MKENYLAMTTQSTLSDGREVTVPIMDSLNAQSTSYTFSEGRGLLFSTQFAQVAITTFEKAAFEDMRAKGLIQRDAAFAGHSLGEYAALAAMAEFMSFESLLGVVFYRGLAMQIAMQKDEEGRTEFAMVAVNPERVHKREWDLQALALNKRWWWCSTD